MMKLTEPEFSFEECIDSCVDGMADHLPLCRNTKSSKNLLLPQEIVYASASKAGNLYIIEPVAAPRNSDPTVVDQLKKSDLVKLYDEYFVPEKKPARRIYNALLNAAKGRCPFCGGIGTPRNLDHFLPKSHFPQFSVLPINLVPSCRDCNMDGKGNGFAVSAEDQIIQPYSDKIQFFQDQWIFATYHSEPNGGPGTFIYRADPPPAWPDIDRDRARKHFRDFNLARRYSTKAAELLVTALGQIQAMRKVGLDADTIITTILEPGVDAAPFINHWQRGMYQALTAWLGVNLDMDAEVIEEPG